MAELKTKKTDADVSAWLDGIADPGRRADCQVLIDIMRAETGAEPKLWGESIVGFGSRHLRYASGRELDWFVTGFSPRKQSLTLYLSYAVTEYPELLARIGKHTLGKGCLYLKRLDGVDRDALRELVRRTTVERAADAAPAEETP